MSHQSYLLHPNLIQSNSLVIEVSLCHVGKGPVGFEIIILNLILFQVQANVTNKFKSVITALGYFWETLPSFDVEFYGFFDVSEVSDVNPKQYPLGSHRVTLFVTAERRRSHCSDSITYGMYISNSSYKILQPSTEWCFIY